ncbi:diguanylate cyclase domain-containing protein [Pseudomonas sp. Q2-TVG4-2]|uniref:diguanylate cyclase domain-containing protein n=1 Tax=Pseudomonas sp. Q2-TVG4-2 TaxID=1685699 RepID=UPI002159FFA0|nr:GGDEF domain-containing protein [Pseudomonas sp. Q2-TVG4-2]
MAQYDELTGLPNRAFLFARLKTALARARRNGERLSLLYLDLNKFKQVNDCHGHCVGDLLLQIFAGRLTQNTREADTVARMGGDEFVVLLESQPIRSRYGGRGSTFAPPCRLRSSWRG